MTEQMSNHPDFAGVDIGPEARARRLRAFTGRVEADDAEMVRTWRDRSPAEHAEAGAQLSDMAAQLAAQTGFGKDPIEMAPGLSSFLRRSQKDAG